MKEEFNKKRQWSNVILKQSITHLDVLSIILHHYNIIVPKYKISRESEVFPLYGSQRT